MPLSGRPTNCALLKITQGSSGPRTNPLQKISTGAGAVASVADDTDGSRRVHRSQPITAMAASRAILNPRAAKFAFVLCGPGSVQGAACPPAGIPFPEVVPGLGR